MVSRAVQFRFTLVLTQNARVSRLNPAFLTLSLIRISSHHPETKFRIALNVSEGSPFVNISVF